MKLCIIRIVGNKPICIYVYMQNADFCVRIYFHLKDIVHNMNTKTY